MPGFTAPRERGIQLQAALDLIGVCLLDIAVAGVGEAATPEGRGLPWVEFDGPSAVGDALPAIISAQRERAAEGVGLGQPRIQLDRPVEVVQPPCLDSPRGSRSCRGGRGRRPASGSHRIASEKSAIACGDGAPAGVCAAARLL